MRRFSTSVSMMWRDMPIPDRFRTAKAAGFTGVEIQVPAEAPATEWAEASGAAGLPVLLLNLDMGDFLGGGPGLSGVPGREAAFSNALAAGVEAVRLLKPAFLHIGPSRVPDGESREDCLAVYRANVAKAAAATAGLGTQLVVEAVNRLEVPTALVGSTAEAAAEAETSGGALKLLFDLYHSAAGGEDPLASYRAHAGLVAHVQFSDLPGRQPPGRGTLDFRALFAGLEGAGYAGLYGAEYMSFAGTADTLGWMAELA
jgi:hydroxypyruvate isomerase